MKESKLYLSQLSDESIYHRKPTKEKPKAPEKPQVAPQQVTNIIITENKNLNKDVDNFDTNNTTPTPKSTQTQTQTQTPTKTKTPIKNNHLVVERNNTIQSMNSKNDNKNVNARQNYNKKNILEKKKKMNEEDENDEDNFEYEEDEEDVNEEDEENEASELNLYNSRETVAVELDSLSDFGKIWNLIMNWVTDGNYYCCYQSLVLA